MLTKATNVAQSNRLCGRFAWAHDAQLFTNDREKLPVAFGHEVSQQSAYVPQVAVEQAMKQPEIAPKQEHSYGFGLGM